MPRRVVSRVISLEPLHVIRAKDKRARELAWSRRTIRDLTTLPEPESSTEKTAKEGKSSKEPSDVNREQMSATSTKSASDSSRPADIAHEVDFPEHAISTAPHQRLDGDCDLPSNNGLIDANATNAESSAGAAPPSRLIFDTDKENSFAIKIQNMDQASVLKDVASSSNEVPTPGPRGKGKLSEPSKRDSTFSRPRRSTRKSYVLPPELDVDWDEDIRPTDHEMDKFDGHGESALNSTDPEYKKSEDRKSPKRKRRQSGPNSSKRRKSINKKPKPIRKEGDRRLQWPLTAEPIVIPQVGVSGPHTSSSSRPLDGQSEAASTQGTAQMPRSCFPNISVDQNQDHSKAAVEKHKVIKISSDSLPSSKQSSPECDIDRQSSHISPASDLNQGRGKVVGTKLSDALRDAGISSGHTMDPATQPNRRSETTVDYKNANISTPHKPLAHSSSYRDSGVTESSMNQGQFALDSDRLVSDSRMIRADYLNLPVTMNLHGLFNNQAYIEINENSDDATHAPMARAMECQEIAVGDLASSQDYAHTTGSKADASSHSSPAAETDRRATLTIQETQGQNTPESEKPLLTKETPLKSRPQSAPRSILVDGNGSPRLANQQNEKIQAPLFMNDYTGSIHLTGVSSSPSDYDQSSEMYSPGDTPESQRTWSKFHRDMVAEFGIDAEQLLHDGDRPISFSKTSISNTATYEASHIDRQHTDKFSEGKPIIHPRRTDGTPPETRTYIAHEMTSAITTTLSTGPITEIGLCARNHTDDHLEDPSLLRASGPSCPGLEPRRSLMQGDANNLEWISALQTAQRSAHDLLQQLSTQLAAEQDTIRDVLQIYRTGCHRILDDLFQAQEVRMELYRQQMSSVKEQHTQICQELIRGLQELDDRVQGP
ncbi:uncharacterized protein N7477_006141 [Penicillium maclennaniae]|uniref:uncharacterized protein n=1 Tax=Penicillium maclennaniae TaxID=1343394 RepID=UPI0025418CD0|nr:uncharacterized protein N7477_006141 [Penicillium maclennaniae]KAJ5670778.1 hypothetical protein N7477_006141 [Penicillium maclennaniae]